MQDAASNFARLLREEATRLRREGQGCTDGRYDWMAAGVEAAADTILGVDSATGKVVMPDALSAMAPSAALREALTNVLNLFHEGRAGHLDEASEGYVRSVVDAGESLLSELLLEQGQ